MNCSNIIEMLKGLRTDQIALFLSILSIVVSVYVAISEKNFKTIQYNDTYFLSIYKDYMLTKIPQCLIKLTFTGMNKLSGEADFIKLLQDMRRDSIYYQFTDNKFYCSLKSSLQDIEDKLTNAHKKEYLVQDQSVFLNEIHNMTKELYELLDRKRRFDRSKGFVRNFFTFM